APGTVNPEVALPMPVPALVHRLHQVPQLLFSQLVALVEQAPQRFLPFRLLAGLGPYARDTHCPDENEKRRPCFHDRLPVSVQSMTEDAPGCASGCRFGA